MTKDQTVRAFAPEFKSEQETVLRDKEHVSIATQPRIEESQESQQATLLPELFFDGSRYYRKVGNEFSPINETNAIMRLRKEGYKTRRGQDGELSELERVLLRVQDEHCIDYAGPLCGRPPGLHEERGVKILSTKGPALVGGTVGDWSAMRRLLGSLLGEGRDDEHFQTQLLTFCGWLKRARQAIRNHGQHLPGQALALVGPPDCGKSMLQSLITLMLGGREADPALWLLGNSNFNSEMWQAEHLRLGDEELKEDRRDRHGLQAKIKKLVSTDLYPLHAKGLKAESFRPIWRLTISANEDHDSISVLPTPTNDFADKIILLRCFAPVMPYHDGSDIESRRFWDGLVAAIPGFVAYLDELDVPEDKRSARYGVREFHHPYVLGRLQTSGPEQEFGELMSEWLGSLQIEGNAVELTSLDITRGLTEFLGEIRAQGYWSGPKHLSNKLRRLAETPAWRGRITLIDPARVGPNRQQVTRWRFIR